MIINENLGIVYIGLPKTGSTAVHRWLMDMPGSVYANPNEQHDFRVPEKHRALEVIATVRHPYSRAISLWRHAHADKLTHKRGAPRLGLSEFVKWMFERSGESGQGMFFGWSLSRRIPQHATIVKLESIDDFRKLQRLSQVHTSPIPVANRNNHGPMATSMTAIAARMIREAWREDFLRFDYDMAY